VIELRPAESDEDLEAWRSVRSAVMPNERTAIPADDWAFVALVGHELVGMAGLAR
jgi:hypothetical protein